MAEPGRQFEGEWEDGSGKAAIDISLLHPISGPKVSISADGGWPEMLLTPGEAVKLADALLTIAGADAGTVMPIRVGWEADPSTNQTGWWIRR
jgi:hypothetical protein